jgi:hypothetical protein
MQKLVDKICKRFREEYAGTGKPVNMNDVWGCLSGDVITNLAFAKSYDLIGTPQWESPFTKAVNNAIITSHWMTHFPWIGSTLNRLPNSFVKALSSTLRPVVEYREV